MTIPASACCAVVLNQQQQTVQHHEHCEQAKSRDQARSCSAGGEGTTKVQPLNESDHATPKQCTVVEHGRVVVRDILPTDNEAPTETI